MPALQPALLLVSSISPKPEDHLLHKDKPTLLLLRQLLNQTSRIFKAKLQEFTTCLSYILKTTIWQPNLICVKKRWGEMNRRKSALEVSPSALEYCDIAWWGKREEYRTNLPKRSVVPSIIHSKREPWFEKIVSSLLLTTGGSSWSLTKHSTLPCSGYGTSKVRTRPTSGTNWTKHLRRICKIVRKWQYNWRKLPMCWKGSVGSLKQSVRLSRRPVHPRKASSVVIIKILDAKEVVYP